MAIEPIGGNENIAALQDQIRKTYQASVLQQKPEGFAQQNEESVSVSLQRASSTMGKLGSFAEEKNQVARGIRAASDTLVKVSSIIDEMKENLGKIIKNYPPFSEESAERKEILMSYISLRKEILSMTFPPPPAPVYEKNTPVWEKLGYNEKGFASSVPELSPKATDSEVRAASTILRELGSIASSARKELVGFVTE